MERTTSWSALSRPGSAGMSLGKRDVVWGTLSAVRPFALAIELCVCTTVNCEHPMVGSGGREVYSVLYVV